MSLGKLQQNGFLQQLYLELSVLLISFSKILSNLRHQIQAQLFCKWVSRLLKINKYYYNGVEKWTIRLQWHDDINNFIIK